MISDYTVPCVEESELLNVISGCNVSATVNHTIRGQFEKA